MLDIETSVTIVQQNNFQRPNKSTLPCLVTVCVHSILWIEILSVPMYPDRRTLFTFIFFLINKSSFVECIILLRWQNVLLKRLIDWKQQLEGSIVSGLLLLGIMGHWKLFLFLLKESIGLCHLIKEEGAVRFETSSLLAVSEYKYLGKMKYIWRLSLFLSVSTNQSAS